MAQRGALVATKKEKDKTVDEPSEPTPETQIRLLVEYLDGRPATEYPDLLDEKAHALLHLVTTGEPVDAPWYHDGLPWNPAVTCWCRSCLASRIDGLPVTRYQYALHDPDAEPQPPGSPTSPPGGWDWEPGDPFMVED